jgi:hypothetical protein
VTDEPWDVFLYKLAGTVGPLARIVADGLAGLLGQGVAPVLAGAVVFLQNLKEHCPEAFDAAGNLRPEWQEIVQAKVAAMQPKSSLPVFHLELATRYVPLYQN